MDSKRRRSKSPVENKEGRDKDYESSGRNDNNSRNLNDSSNARTVRGYESRQSDRTSYGTSRESKRHDDDRRYRDKHAGDYGRSHSRASRSDRELRADAYYDCSKRDSTSGRARGDQRDADSRYGEKSARDYRRYDGGEYDRYADTRKPVEKRDYYRAADKDRESKEEDVVKKRSGKEIEKEAEVETREKKRSLFSSWGPSVDCSEDAKLSTTTNEALDNSGGTVDGVNAAKCAAMKAAESVNRNIASFGAGSGRLSTEQKKKLLWGNKKSNPSDETSKRWDANLFSDRERQEKFNKLMSLRMPWWLWPIAGCEEQRTADSGEQGWEPIRSQENRGAGHQPGEALHSRPPPERWPDCWSWSVGNNVRKCYRMGRSESPLCTMLRGLFILVPRSLTGCLMLVLSHNWQCMYDLCTVLLYRLSLWKACALIFCVA